MGERLRALRKSHTLTQEQLAEKIYNPYLTNPCRGVYQLTSSGKIAENATSTLDTSVLEIKKAINRYKSLYSSSRGLPRSGSSCFPSWSCPPSPA